MFIGHFGIGMAAKKYAPEVSLGTLFIAAQFLDLLWPWLLIFNVEHVALRPGTNMLDFTYFPVTHSLVMVILWSILFGSIYWLFKRNTKVAIILALCVLSHWILDLIVHFPDLPLYPGNSPLLGMGLWNSRVGTLIVEGAIFIAGIIIYMNTTKAKNKTGKFSFWGLIFLLVILHLSSVFGPPPSNIASIGWLAQLQWIFIFVAYWTDKNRSPVQAILLEQA